MKVDSNWERYCNDSCLACPFNINEVSETAYNLGCLPAPYEIIKIKTQYNLNWECHNGTGKICGGFVAVCKDESIDYTVGDLIDTGYYLQTGHRRIKITHPENL